MYNARRTERILDSVEARAFKKLRPLLREAEDALIASVSATGSRMAVSKYEKAIISAMRVVLRPMYRHGLGAGILESDAELVAMLRAEKLSEEESKALLGRSLLGSVRMETEIGAGSTVENSDAVSPGGYTALADETPGTLPASTSGFALKLTDSIEEIFEQAVSRLGVEPKPALKRMRSREKFYSERFGKRRAREIRRSVRGLIRGQASRAEIVKELQFELKSTRAQAVRVLRTETTWAYAAGKAEVGFSTRGVTHFRFRSVNDNRRSKICESRDQKIWSVTDKRGIRENSPPLHGHCRSTWELVIGTLKSQRRRVNAKKYQPLKRGDRGFVPLSPGWKPSSATGVRTRRRRRIGR